MGKYLKHHLFLFVVLLKIFLYVSDNKPFFTLLPSVYALLISVDKNKQNNKQPMITQHEDL